MTIENEGIYVAGNGKVTIKGPAAVGDHAHVVMNEVRGDAWVDVRRLAQELLEQITAEGGEGKVGADVAELAEATVEELDRPEPRPGRLNSLVGQLSEGLKTAAPLLTIAAELGHAIAALV